jgi:glutaconate CoA-transferase subunit B
MLEMEAIASQGELFSSVTKRMTVESLHPGVTKEEVIQNTGFGLLFNDPLPVTREPSEEELRILREEVDPEGVIIGK